MPRKSSSSGSNSSSSGSSSSEARGENKVETVVSTTITLERLSRNVTVPHLDEIFSNFGKVQETEIRPVSQGSNKLIALVKFELREAAEKAVDYMNEGQLDGLTVLVKLADYK